MILMMKINNLYILLAYNYFIYILYYYIKKVKIYNFE